MWCYSFLRNAKIMNLKEELNRAFIYNRGMVLHESNLAEMSRKRQEKLKKIKTERARRKQLSLISSTQSHFRNLQKFVTDIFAEPSELSQFIIDKILISNYFRFISKQKLVQCEPREQDDLLELIPGARLLVSSRLKEECFHIVDLAEIKSLSTEDLEYFVALIISESESSDSKKRNDLKGIELIVYEHKKQSIGFLNNEEVYMSNPPVSAELCQTLKNLKDLNEFCRAILNNYQHLITP